MPNVTATPRDGQTYFMDGVGISDVVYTYPLAQQTFTLINTGTRRIIYSLGPFTDITLNPGSSDTRTVDAGVSSFKIRAEYGYQSFTMSSIQLPVENPSFDQRLDNVESSLAENAINPDRYIGTDLQRIQQAIDDACTNHRSINLWRVFDITGGTLKLKQNNRIPVTFTGINKGGIKKTDNGFIFDTDLSMVSDYHFDNVYFESIPGVGTKIFNANKIFIVKTNGCMYENIDTLVYTNDSGYVQSYRHVLDKCIGGSGAFFDIAGAYDTSINECYFEDRQDVFIHRLTSDAANQNNLLFNCRIVDSIFQSCRDAIMVRGMRVLKIDGCYFEGNQSDITFLSNLNGFYYNPVVSNCSDFGSTGTAMIKWGPANNNALSINNQSAIIPLHDFSAMSSGYILGINDKASSNIGDVSRYYNMVQSKTITNGVEFGPFRKYHMSSGTLTVPANTTQTLTLTFPENLELDDFISVQMIPSDPSTNGKFILNLFNRDWSNKKNLTINYTSNNSASTNLTIVASVLKMFPNT